VCGLRFTPETSMGGRSTGRWVWHSGVEEGLHHRGHVGLGVVTSA